MGLLDGLGQTGRFDFRAMEHQIAHGRPLVGGAVSRIALNHALAQLKIEPAEALHIGDSIRRRRPGRTQGRHRSSLIDRGGGDQARLRAEHDDPDLVVVSDLLELLDLLGIERPAAVTAPA